jgi:hypothetical protein
MFQSARVIRHLFILLIAAAAMLNFVPTSKGGLGTGTNADVFLISPILNTPMPSGPLTVQFQWQSQSAHTSCCRGGDKCYAALIPNDGSGTQQLSVPTANNFKVGTHTVSGFVTSTRESDGRRNYIIQIDIACANYPPPPGQTGGHGTRPADPVVGQFKFEVVMVDDN